MKFKVKLQVAVRLAAYCDIKLEAENEDDAYEKAIETYQEITTNYEQAMRLYRQNKTSTWPDPPYFWHVDDEDIEANMDDRDIEVYSAEPILDVPEDVMERKPQ